MHLVYYGRQAGGQAHHLIPDTAVVSAARFDTWKLVGAEQRCDIMSVTNISIIYEPFSGSSKVLSPIPKIW
jgi:hypothetical protein